MTTMYLTRNKSGLLRLFHYTPQYNDELDMWYEEHFEDGYGNFWSDECPEVTFENSPKGVELKLVNNVQGK